jgi:hypothetical protein
MCRNVGVFVLCLLARGDCLAVFRLGRWESHMTNLPQPPSPPLFPAPTFSQRVLGGLQDIHNLCQEWAAHGECKKNPEFMIGNTGTGLGQCRRSCDSCEVCKEGDTACQTRNREALGFLPLDQLD